MPNDDLDLSVGRVLVMRDMETRETADFHVIEVVEYRGQIVVYGELSRHGIVIGKGPQVVPQRPSCWAYIKAEDPQRVMRLAVLLGGKALVILQDVQTSLINVAQTSVPLEKRSHPILQAGSLVGIPGYGEGAGRYGMIKKAMRLVDVYWGWREKNHYGRLPAWVDVGTK